MIAKVQGLQDQMEMVQPPVQPRLLLLDAVVKTVEESMKRDMESNSRACGMNEGFILNSLGENLSRS